MNMKNIKVNVLFIVVIVLICAQLVAFADHDKSFLGLLNSPIGAELLNDDIWIKDPAYKINVTPQEMNEDDELLLSIFAMGWYNIYDYETNVLGSRYEGSTANMIYDAIKNGPAGISFSAKNKKSKNINLFFLFNNMNNYWMNWDLETNEIIIHNAGLVGRYAEDVEFFNDMMASSYINGFYQNSLIRNIGCSGSEIYKILDHYYELKRGNKEKWDIDKEVSVLQNKEGICIANKVNIREKPEMNGKSIGTLNKGDKVVVLQDNGEWCKVQSGTKEGYIKGQYIQFDKTVYDTPSKGRDDSKTDGLYWVYNNKHKLYFKGKEIPLEGAYSDVLKRFSEIGIEFKKERDYYVANDISVCLEGREVSSIEMRIKGEEVDYITIYFDFSYDEIDEAIKTFSDSYNQLKDMEEKKVGKLFPRTLVGYNQSKGVSIGTSDKTTPSEMAELVFNEHNKTGDRTTTYAFFDGVYIQLTCTPDGCRVYFGSNN